MKPKPLAGLVCAASVAAMLAARQPHADLRIGQPTGAPSHVMSEQEALDRSARLAPLLLPRSTDVNAVVETSEALRPDGLSQVRREVILTDTRRRTSAVAIWRADTGGLVYAAWRGPDDHRSYRRAHHISAQEAVACAWYWTRSLGFDRQVAAREELGRATLDGVWWDVEWHSGGRWLRANISAATGGPRSIYMSDNFPGAPHVEGPHAASMRSVAARR